MPLPLLVALPALAGVTIRAEVDADLRHLHGTLTASEPLPALSDPLAALPVPATDELVQATFPGAVSRGHVTWAATGPETWAFTAELPRRYGDIGAVRGLFANGGWYPQPEGLPILDWDVTVTLPPGTTGALGDCVGTKELHWVGRAERASLAVVPRGVVTEISSENAKIRLLTRGKPRRVLTRRLTEGLPSVVPDSGPKTGAIVEAPLRRRLVRAGPRLTYLSDRTWRLTPGFHRFHDVAGMRGAASAMLDVPDPFARDLASAGIAARYGDGLAGTSAENALKWVAWIPIFDRMLHGKHTPFLAEILEAPLPGDPVQDDLAEVYAPYRPGAAVLAQVDDRYGDGMGARLARRVEAGATPEEASVEMGISTDALREPLPTQDYRLSVHQGVATIRRDAPPDAPPETVLYTVDGVPNTWAVGRGPAELQVDPPFRTLALDPAQHVSQTSTAGDTWPARFTPVFSAWFSRIDLRQLYFQGFAQLALRRQYDTRWTAKLRIYADEQTTVGAELGYVRMFGRELDGLRREHQLGAWVTPGILSARYAPTGETAAVVGGGLTYTWDDTVARYFPVRGHRLFVGTDAGIAPATGSSWRAVRGEGLVYLSPHPRVAFPIEALGGLAAGDIEHRLVDLGGLGGMRSLPPAEQIGTARAIGRVEARFAVLHQASVPLFLMWADEVSLSVGAEAGTARVDGETVAAAGATAGVGWQVSLLGANPSSARLRVGYPLWTRGIDLGARRAPQVVFEAEQIF